MLGRLLEPEEQSAGPPGLDAVGRERVEDVKERKLYVLHGFQRGKMELDRFGPSTEASLMEWRRTSTLSP